MKLTVLIILALSLLTGITAKAQTVTITQHNASLKQVFKEIEVQTGYFFLCRDEWLSQASPVTIDVKNSPLKDVLVICFRNQPLTWSILDNVIVVKQKNSTEAKVGPIIAAPPGTVKGRITDSQDKPLPGATIVVKGTSLSAITDPNGNFAIAAKPGQVLLISYVGYQPVEYRVSGTANIIVPLTPKSGDLTAVTVVSTGYQNITKERSAGSFVTVGNDAIKNKTVSMNVIDRLEGLASGLAVNYGDGNEKFLLRGLSSINAAKSPLYVVDGVPIYDYNTITTLINPNDVETVSFLKDATATSIWGAAAANGVIVITTKKGKTGSKKIQVSYNGFVTFKGRPDYSYQKMMNTPQFLLAAEQIFSPADYPWAIVSTASGSNTNLVVYPHEQVLYDLSNGLINQSTADARIDSLSWLSNRSQINQYLLQPALLTNHSLSFTGGSEFNSYYGSIAYTRDQQATKSNLNRYQANLRQDFIFTPAIRVDLTTNLAFEQSKDFELPALPATTDDYLPYAMFKDGAGNNLSQAYLKRYAPFRSTIESLSKINLDYIPLNEPGYTKNNQTNFSARINAGITIRLAKGLSYEGRFQYQRGVNEGYVYYNQNSYRVRDERVYYTQAPATPGGAPTYYLPSSGGHYLTNSTTQVAWTVRNQLSFDRTFGKRSQLTALAGTEVRNALSRQHNTFRRGYDFQTESYYLYDENALATTGVTNPVVQKGTTSTNTLSSTPETFIENESRFFSFYGNIAYTLDRKYTLNSSIRMDQSNLFGTDRSAQYKPIWSAGGAWNISKEQFFQSKDINNLSLRLTYGLGGNAPAPGSGGPYDILSPNTSSLFNGLGTGYIISTPANDKLVWERTATTNAGIDLGMFANRITASVDAYRKITSNLLGYQPVNPTTGWYYAYTNLGKIENKGIELQLNTVNINKKYFTWKSTFTLSYNKNKILELKSNAANTFATKMSSTFPFVEGYSAYSLFGYKYIGLDAGGNPMALKSSGKDTAKLSSQLTYDDPLYKGTTQPLWYGGLTNNFTYKNVSLSFLIVYNLGHQLRRDVNEFYAGRLATNIPVYFNDRWQKPGDEAFTNVPKYIPNTNTNVTQRFTDLYTNADINVVSASYAKLRDITLSYTLPLHTLEKMAMNDFTLYAQMGNILLWTQNKYGIDPEYFNLMTGTRTDRMPPSFTIGVRTTFK